MVLGTHSLSNSDQRVPKCCSNRCIRGQTWVKEGHFENSMCSWARVGKTSTKVSRSLLFKSIILSVRICFIAVRAVKQFVSQ